VGTIVLDLVNALVSSVIDGCGSNQILQCALTEISCGRTILAHRKATAERHETRRKIRNTSDTSKKLGISVEDVGDYLCAATECIYVR
jgi:hypothetical protein